MFDADQVEQVVAVSGGLLVRLRGDYTVDGGKRHYPEVEFSWAAVEKLVQLFDQALFDKEGKP